MCSVITNIANKLFYEFRTVLYLLRIRWLKRISVFSLLPLLLLIYEINMYPTFTKFQEPQQTLKTISTWRWSQPRRWGRHKNIWVTQVTDKSYRVDVIVTFMCQLGCNTVLKYLAKHYSRYLFEDIFKEGINI